MNIRSACHVSIKIDGEGKQCEQRIKKKDGDSTRHQTRLLFHTFFFYFLFIFCGLLSQGNSMLHELGDAICLSEVVRGKIYSNTWTYVLFLCM